MTHRHDRSSKFLVAQSGIAVDAAPGSAGPPGHDATGDVLSDVLRTIRLSGALFFQFEASSPWANEVPTATALVPSILPGVQHVVSYHIVSKGTCWVTLADGPSVHLDTGDVVVIPHGDTYIMSSAPGMHSEIPADAVLMFFRRLASGSAPSIVTEGGGGPEGTDLVCGFLGCDVRPFNPVLEALPRLVHLQRPAEVSTHDRLGALIDFALAESRQRRSGAQSVLLRLSEVLFIEVIRRYLDSVATDRRGWLAGLRDPMIGRVLVVLHDRPAVPWTLERLAKEIGVSRSVLAARFTHLVGQPPMHYLTFWRMQLAARLLADGTAKVSAVALHVGYESEAAFSRAYKQVVGVSPATWRRRNSAQ